MTNPGNPLNPGNPSKLLFMDYFHIKCVEIERVRKYVDYPDYLDRRSIAMMFLQEDVGAQSIIITPTEHPHFDISCLEQTLFCVNSCCSSCSAIQDPQCPCMKGMYVFTGAFHNILSRNGGEFFPQQEGMERGDSMSARTSIVLMIVAAIIVLLWWLKTGG